VPLSGSTITGDLNVVSGILSAVTYQGITPTMVGLGNVDNTSDVNKPVSTAQRTAIDLKVPLSGSTITGSLKVVSGTLSAVTYEGITPTMVGLGNVDNTSDVNKPVSTAQRTAIDLKVPLSGSTITGNLNVVSGSLSAVTYLGLPVNQGNLPLTGGTITGDLNVVSGSLSAVTYLGIDKTTVGLGNVDNTSDVNKPVSTAQQTALNLKANIAGPTFTGTVGGITSAIVGLGNVTNASGANKPESTAQQTA